MKATKEQRVLVILRDFGALPRGTIQSWCSFRREWLTVVLESLVRQGLIEFDGVRLYSLTDAGRTALPTPTPTPTPAPAPRRRGMPILGIAR